MEKVDLLTFGEAMVSLRSSGPLAQGGTLTTHMAGSEANVAVAMSRLGHTTKWVGRLGEDPHGEFIRRQLGAEFVEGQITVDPDRATGVMFLEQRTADVSRALYYRSGSAGSEISPLDLEPALAESATILHLTGITPALSANARMAFERAAAGAAAAGMMVSLDVNYRNKLWSREDAREVLSAVAGYAQIVIASEDELNLLAPKGSAAADSGSDAGVAGIAAELLALGVNEVVVKLGADGAEVYTLAGKFHVDAKAVSVVDTVGAGDAFTAGYLSAVVDGESIEARLVRGNTLGAFAVSTRGDWEGLPNRAELDLLSVQAMGSTQR
ncbi:sugar kinase [Arthrobacter alpinus]|uniref:sugar kinase n=1 Tax=Arthrobacter alpinus TaxID=656366 RepID=UPI0005C9A558|nr:sugar kinase [Arthrobacter alpinus]ALV46601.1 sugar kinase [Arthrobacter alpinus]